MSKYRQTIRTAAILGALLGHSVFAGTPPDPLARLTALAARNAPVDIAETLLEIDRGLNGTIDVAVYRNRLDAMASELRVALAQAENTREKLERMAEIIYGKWGFADSKTLPADVYVSFADVLDKKQWNCFGMSMLYLALGERVGLPMAMVAGRGHALVRTEGDVLYVETTQRGNIHESTAYLADYLPYPCTEPAEYVAVPSRTAIAVSLTQTGAALAARGNMPVAELCFRHALEYDSQYAETHAAIGFVAMTAGNAVRALESLRKAIALDPKQREAHGGLGTVLHATGDLDGAEKAFRDAVALCKSQPEPLFNLGQVLFEKGDLAGAESAFRAYTELVPLDADGYVRLAFPLEDLGKLDEALAAYAAALRINPRHIDAMVNSGGISEKQAKWEAARAWYEKALALSSSNPFALTGMGRVLTEQGQYDAATRFFEQSIMVDAGNPATWIDFARLQKKRGDLTGAMEKLETALRIAPKEPETHVELALIYLGQKNATKAREHARIARDLGETLSEPLASLLRAEEGASE